MKVIVLGAGLQGIATTLDLAWNKKIEKIMLADFKIEKAEAIAKLCNDKYGHRVDTTYCDVNDQKALIELIKGYDVVINLVNYYFNCSIMEACLDAKVNYIDIGGLYVETIKQVEYDQQFKDAGLLCIIGIGGTPGLTNVCAEWAAQQLDTVETINFYCGSDGWGVSNKAFEVTYSIETIMDEFQMKPVQYLDGKYVEVEPKSGVVNVQYPDPVGQQKANYVMHSEIGTVAESYKDKGLKNCTYRIGFPEEVLDKLTFLHEIGFSKQEGMDLGKEKIRPVKILQELLDSQPDDPNATINDCDIIKTEVIGIKDGEKIKYDVDVICRPVKEWPELMGAQVYIGGAPAWAAELMRMGVINKKGALAPENCIPPIPFFEEAAKREIYVRATKTVLLGSTAWDEAMKKELIDQGR